MKRAITISAFIFLIFLYGCIDNINSAPEVTLISNSPTKGEAPLYIDISYGCKDLEDEKVRCIVKVDNKTIMDEMVPPYPEKTLDPLNKEGKHVLEVIAIDSEGLKDSKKLTYFVTSKPKPVVEIKSDVLEGRVPFYPQFNYVCYDPKGLEIDCYVEVEGKKIYLGENLEWPENETIVFQKPGNYKVEIVGVNSEGEESRDSLIFKVRPELYVYVEKLPDGVGEEYRKALLDAFKFWENELGVKFYITEDWNEKDIYIDWAKEYAGETVGRAEIGGKRMIVGLGDSNCYQKYREYKPEYVKKIAEHELGHILGFEHSEDKNNIMYPIIPGLAYSIDVEEEEVIPGGWYWFFPTCSNFDSANYRFIVESDKRVDVYVVPSKNEYDKAVKGGRFKYYKPCKEENTEYFDKICNIGKDAGAMIINNNKGTARINIKIINVD